MRKLMGKRGDSTHFVYMFLYQMVLFALVSAMIFGYIHSLKTNTMFEKNYLSKDSALLSNALEMAPESVFYSYSPFKGRAGNALDMFVFDFRENKATVQENPANYDKKPIRIFYPYAHESSASSSMPVITGPANIDFFKAPYNFFIRGNSLDLEKSPYQLMIRCPVLSTKKENWAAGDIIIDPAHQMKTEKSSGKSVDTGYTNSNKPDFSESKVSLTIAKNLNSLYSYDLTRKSDGAVSMENRIIKTKNKEIVITIKTGSDKLNENQVKAYISSSSSKKTESSKLACSLINSILSNPDLLEAWSKKQLQPITGTGIIQVDPLTIGSEDPLKILSAAAGGVTYEYANLIQEGDNYFIKTSRIKQNLKALPPDEIEFLKKAEITHIAGFISALVVDAAFNGETRRFFFLADPFVYIWNGSIIQEFFFNGSESVESVTSGITKETLKSTIPYVYKMMFPEEYPDYNRMLAADSDDKEKIVVVLELGNIQISGSSFLIKSDLIAKSIKAGIEEYYRE